MNNRFDDAKLKQYSTLLVLGTFSNIISTFFTLPLQYVFTQRQLHPARSYRSLYGYAFSYAGIKEVYSESRTAMKMASKQSVAYLGVSSIAFEYYKNDEPLVKGLKAGLWSSAAESLVTAKDLQKMISGWNHAQKVDKKLAFKRSLQGTMLKNAVANPLTLSLFSYTEWVLQQSMNSTSPAYSALAGMISAFLAAPVVAPFSALQTNVQNDPTLTLSQHFKKISNESIWLLWKGGAARGVYKASDGLIKFGLRGLGLAAISKLGQSEPPPVRARDEEERRSSDSTTPSNSR